VTQGAILEQSRQMLVGNAPGMGIEDG